MTEPSAALVSEPDVGEVLRYVVPTGMLGGGFSEDLFAEAVATGIDFVAIDSGSTDGGPNNLGDDIPFNSRAANKRDIAILVRETRRAGIPLLIGSAGGSGGNANLAYIREIVLEVAREEGLHFTLATIQAEPDRDVLIEKYRAGRIRPLDPAPEIDEGTLRDTTRIVAMMGPEPFQQALRDGADVVVAGRSSDAALVSAIPLMRGFEPGLVWHASKIAECGGAAVTQMTRPEGMIVEIARDRFTLTPVSPDQSVSPVSIASHALYETANPLQMLEPGGVMLLDEVKYEQIDERSVTVTGSRFEPMPYTVKLEGATRVGYRSAVLGGVTDPVILRDWETWFERAKAAGEFNARRSLGDEVVDACRITYKVYGRNAVLGPNESRSFVNDHEVGVFIDVVADDQETAHGVVSVVSHTIHHFAVPQWNGLVSNLAFPVAPYEMDLGSAFTWSLNHVVELDDPLELFDITLEEI